MEISKEELVKMRDKFLLEAKKAASSEYQEGYSDGVLDMFNQLIKRWPVAQSG